ncbi:helix-turn-helix domain-containing protein [Thioclava sp. 15-R06ZXC-3]|uniref:Helix-turn-helix domain-containing protein n=1 Tax=Thioclava arctica TaxID=3238301 RepID=A0ABV3TNE6_9RHOB
MSKRSKLPNSKQATELLSAADLLCRWQAGSAATLWRAEQDGLLIPLRSGRRRGYAWETVWAFEGGQAPRGLEAAYRQRLLTPEDAALLCPFRPSTLIAKAKQGFLPYRRIGSRVRFVPAEIQRWLGTWA